MLVIPNYTELGKPLQVYMGYVNIITILIMQKMKLLCCFIKGFFHIPLTGFSYKKSSSVETEVQTSGVFLLVFD